MRVCRSIFYVKYSICHVICCMLIVFIIFLTIWRAWGESEWNLQIVSNISPELLPKLDEIHSSFYFLTETFFLSSSRMLSESVWFEISRVPIWGSNRNNHKTFRSYFRFSSHSFHHEGRVDEVDAEVGTLHEFCT